MEIKFGPEKRQIVANHLRLALRFNRQFEIRESLGHDCGMFALACVTGRTYDTVQIGERSGQSVVVGNPRFLDVERLIDVNNPAGTVTLTTLTPRTEIHDTVKLAAPHLAVTTSVDGGDPLYFSKLGTRGPVVLSDAESLERFYPLKSVALVDDIALRT